MKNSKQPINPIGEFEYKRFTEEIGVWNGLTKREYFSVLAMQGMLANPNTGTIENGKRLINTTDIANSSVQFANELLKQLEK
jgi:hypothetical protein